MADITETSAFEGLNFVQIQAIEKRVGRKLATWDDEATDQNVLIYAIYWQVKVAGGEPGYTFEEATLVPLGDVNRLIVPADPTTAS